MDKKLIFVNIANEVIENYKEKEPYNVYISKKIPEKKLKNAKKSLNVPEGEEALILFDDTAFGSAKDGMLFTTWGIRYKEDGDWTVSWEELYKNGYEDTKAGIIKDHYTLLLYNKRKKDYSVPKEMILHVVIIDFSIMKLLVRLGTEVIGNENSTITTFEQFIEEIEETIEEMEEEREKDEAETEEMLNKAGAFAKNIFKGALQSMADDMNTPHVYQCNRCGAVMRSIGVPGGKCPASQTGLHQWWKVNC